MLNVIVRDRELKISFYHDVPYETQCFIHSGEKLVATGYASCSDKDNFDRKVGRKLSMSRALLHAHLSKEERKFIWGEYFSKLGKKSVLDSFNDAVSSLEATQEVERNNQAAAQLKADFDA